MTYALIQRTIINTHSFLIGSGLLYQENLGVSLYTGDWFDYLDLL